MRLNLFAPGRIVDEYLSVPERYGPPPPADVVGLMAAAVRDPDPVIFCEHKALFAIKGEVPDGEVVDTLGTARILRTGADVTIVALAAMVPKALEAADRLASEQSIDAEVIDLPP